MGTKQCQPVRMSCSSTQVRGLWGQAAWLGSHCWLLPSDSSRGLWGLNSVDAWKVLKTEPLLLLKIDQPRSTTRHLLLAAFSRFSQTSVPLPPPAHSPPAFSLVSTRKQLCTIPMLYFILLVFYLIKGKFLFFVLKMGCWSSQTRLQVLTKQVPSRFRWLMQFIGTCFKSSETMAELIPSRCALLQQCHQALVIPRLQPSFHDVLFILTQFPLGTKGLNHVPPPEWRHLFPRRIWT